MEFIKQWSFCVCTSLIISSVFSLLAPEGSMNKFWKTMLSAFIFVSFIIPFKDFSASDFKLENYDLDSSVYESADSVYENGVNAQIKEFLTEKGITGANVSSRVKYIAESSEIEINEVVISIPDEYDKSEIKRLVFEEMGINSRVVYLGE